MIDQTKIALDKIEVARRQLCAGLELWFADGEPVAIHTLACAAHEILATLLNKQGKRALMFDPSLYQPGWAGEMKKAIHKHYNFFKHADKDAEATIEFPVGITEIYLFMAAEGWRELVGAREPLHFAFWAWCLFHHPEAMKLYDRQTGAPMKTFSQQERSLFIGIPKQQFRILTMGAFNQEDPSEVLARLKARFVIKDASEADD